MSCTFKYKGKTFSTDRLYRELVKELPSRSQQESIAFLVDYLGMSEQDVLIVKGLIENRSLGRFKADGKILLSELATIDVAYHEAFHRVWRMYLTTNERASAIKEVKQKKNYSTILAKYKEVYPSLTESELVEEFLADEFSDFVLNQNFKTTLPLKSIFQRLWNFIKKLLGLSTSDIQTIYDKILAKTYKSSPMSAQQYLKDADKILIGGAEFSVEQKNDITQMLTQRFVKAMLTINGDIDLFLSKGSTKIKQMLDEVVIPDLGEAIYSMSEEYGDLVDAFYNDVDPILKENRPVEESIFMNGMIKNLKLLGLQINELEDETDGALTTEEKRTREFQSSIEFDPKARMGKKIKFLLSSLTDTSQNNSFGLPVPLSWTKGFVQIATRMAGVPTKAFMDELQKLNFSYIKPLVNYLSQNIVFENEFVSTMAMTENKFVTMRIKEGDFYFDNANSGTKVNKVVNDWKNNLIRKYADFDQWMEDVKQISKSKFNDDDVLELFGFEVNPNVENLTTQLRTIIQQVAKYNGGKPDSKNVFKELGIKKYVEELAEKQTLFEEAIDLMVYINGKKLYSLGLNTQQTSVINAIKFVQSKFTPEMSQEDKVNLLREYIPFQVSEFNVTKKQDGTYEIHNLWLQKILNGERLDLVIPYNIDSQEDDLEVSKLEEPDLMALHLNGALQGYNMSMKHADRSTFFAYSFGKPLYTKSQLGSISDALFILTENLIEQINLEVKFLKNLEIEKFPVQHIGKIKTGAFGSAILGKAFESVLNGQPIDRKAVETFVENQFTEYKKYVSSLGILDEYYQTLYNEKGSSFKVKSLRGINRTILNEYGNADTVLAAAFVNEVSSHIFENRFFSGLAEAFKSGTDLFKRLAPQSSTGKLSVNSAKVHNHVREQLNQSFSVLNPRTGKQVEINPSTFLTKPEFFRAITLAEREDYKSHLLQPALTISGKPVISKLTGKQESKLFMMFEDGFVKDFPNKSLEELQKTYESKFRLYEKKYLAANENDGQSYMTLPAFKNFMLRQGKWPDGMEFVYQTEMAISKFSSQLDIADLEIEFKGVKIKPFEVRKTKIGEKEYDGWKYRIVDNKLIKLDAVHTLKTQFAGYSTPEEYYEQNKSEFSYMFNSVFKTSQHLLLPSAIIGTNLQLMNFSLMSNGIDIAHMGSANKVGGVDPKLAAKNILSNNDDIRNTSPFISDISERGLDFYDKNGYFNDEAIAEHKDILTYLSDWEALKDQVEIGNKVKDEIKGSTQSLKILLSNLIVNKAERFPGAKQLVDSYLEVVRNMVQKNHDSLLKRIGFDVETGEFKTLDELKKAILESTQMLSAPENVRNAVENFFNDPSIGLEATPMKNKIENVLYSLITNGIISFDRPGSSYPQAAITGYEPLGSRKFNEDGIQESSQDTLKFYNPIFDEDGNLTKVEPAEVIIPLPDFWIQPLLRWAKTNNLVKAIEKLNQDIELRPDLYTFKGLRIPNQQLSSNDVLKVKKFNLPTMQNYILVPTEIVIKVGSDFDIDSIKFYWSEDTANKIFSDMSDIELLDMYDNYVSVSQEQGLDTISFENYKTRYSSKDSLDRTLLDLEKQILLHPRNAHHLLMPVTDEIFVQDTYKELKNEGLIEEPNKEFVGSVLPSTNVKNAIVFVKGKGGVGPVALGITNAATNQIDNLDINQQYFGEGFGETKNLFSGLKDNYDLGNYVDTKGTVISENQSQLLSTQVDNVKNPTAVLLGINMQTLGVLGLMIRRRVAPKSVILLFKQPLVQAYLNAQKLNESQIYKASNAELSKKKLIKKLLESKGYKTDPPNVYELNFTLSDKQMLIDAKQNKFDQNQLIYLSYFLELQEQAKEFGRFQSTQNSDTKGLKDKQALEEFEATQAAVSTVAIVEVADQMRLNQSGVISPFYQYGRLRYKIYNPFYALGKTNFGGMLTNFKHLAAESVNFNLKDKVRQTIENDFMLFLLHNSVLSKSEFNRLMKDDSVSKRVLTLKEKLPSNLVLKAFFPMLNNAKDFTTNEKLDNLRLFEKELNQLDSNDMRLSLEEIAETDIELYNDMVKLLFFQTGLNIGPFNYSSIVPVGLNSKRNEFNAYQYLYQDLLKQAIQTAKVDFDTATKVFEDFKLLFAANNPRFLKKHSPYIWNNYPFKLATVKDRESKTVKLKPQKGNESQVQLGDAYHKQYFVDLINPNLFEIPVSLKEQSDVRMREAYDYKEPIVSNDENSTEEISTSEYELFPGVFANQGQTEALNLIRSFLNSNENEFTLIGRGGTGKAQPLYSKIYTPDGYKLMGDIQKDDFVISEIGTPVKVLDVFPQGVKPLYRVYFNDGFYVDCCDEHNWLLKSLKTRRRELGLRSKFNKMEDSYEIFTTNQIKNSVVEKNELNYKLPINKAVNFNQKNLKIDPYLLGALIGDGGLSRDISFTNIDQFILEKINSIVESNYAELSLKQVSNTITFRITKKKRGIKFNSLLNEIRQLGLNVKSDRKFIPFDYLYSSIKDRINLLNGLMDTDGTVDKKGTHISYSTCSKQLADDVAELVQSLGCLAKISYKENDFKGCYNVTINQNNEFDIFSLPRKQNLVVDKTKYKTSRYIKSVEYLGETEQQCILVDSPTHLYLTDNFTVTHNTTIIKKILEDVKKQGKKVLGITVAHKAKKVLGKSIGKSKVKTVASALAIKLDETTGNFVPDMFAREQGRVPIKGVDVIIVDEASMISPAIYQEIMDLKKSGAKVIFMGDNAQLPPVGKDVDNPVFNLKNKYTLTEKMRQAKTSPIINIGSVVAENIESNSPQLTAIKDRISKYDEISKSGVVFIKDEDLALNAFVEDFRRSGGMDPDYVKAITFNNELHNSPQSVKNLNDKIRLKLWGEASKEQFVEGELVTAYSTYSRDSGGDENEIPAHNSDDFIVTDVEYRNSQQGFVTAYSNKDGTRKFNYKYDIVILSLLNSDGKPIIGYSVPVIANSSKLQYEQDVAKLWKTDKGLAFALTNEFANIQYGYAITSHKAQGSTYTNTYVFEDNILGRTNAGDALTKNKSLYVAVSRPTTKLVMVSEKNEDVINPKVLALPEGEKSVKLKIISGGQFGGDLGGLLAAKELGLETGGTAPKGFKVDYSDKRSVKGSNPDLVSFGLIEDDSADYPSRTMKNVDNSDGTIAFMWGPSVGTSKTIGYAQTGKWVSMNNSFNKKPVKPYLVITSKDLNIASEQIKDFIQKYNINVLNVAGHRETSQPGIEQFVKESLVKGLVNTFVQKKIIGQQGSLFNNSEEPTEFFPLDWDRSSSNYSQEISVVYNNTVLSTIGTISQYKQYLNTIFPNSNFNKEYYHLGGIGIKEFEKEFFGKGEGSNNSGEGFYFSTSPAWDLIDPDTFYENEDPVTEAFRKGSLYIVKLNGSNSKKYGKFEIDEDFDSIDNQTYYQSKISGEILISGEIVVKEPNQIYILGSEQDILQFKNFVKNNGVTSNYSPSVKMYEGFIKLNHLYTGDEILPFIGESEYYRYLVPMLLKMNPEVQTMFTNHIKYFARQIAEEKQLPSDVIAKLDELIIDGTVRGSSFGNINTNFVRSDSSGKTIVHELIHRTLQKEYDANTDFTSKINELYDYAQKHDDFESYGFTSEKEFLAEAMSNPDFMEVLNNIPYKGQTMWTYLMTLISDFINNLLNIELKSDSVLAEVVRVSEQVLNRNLEELSKKKKVTLSELQEEIINNWNTYFPQYDWMNMEQKQMTAKLVEEGKITLNCSF